MASVRKDPRNPKKWQVRYRSADGKERTLGGYPSKADAQAARSTIEHQLRTGEWRDPSLRKITVRTWTEQFLNGREGAVAASTFARDRRVLDSYLLPVIGDMPIGSVNPIHMRKVIDPLKEELAGTTIRGIYSVIKTLFNEAVIAQLISTTPCLGVRVPTSAPGEVRFLSMDELDHLADCIDEDYRAFVFVGGVLGLRFSEIAGLRVTAIDFIRRLVTVRETVSEVEGRLLPAPVKTKASARTLNAPRFVMAELSRHLEDRDLDDRRQYVFHSPRGGPLRYSNFHRNIWSPAIRASGLDAFRIHGLRHSAAGFLIAQNKHPKLIQQWMGHSSIKVTFDVYGSVMPVLHEEVADSLDAAWELARGAAVVRMVGDG